MALLVAATIGGSLLATRPAIAAAPPAPTYGSAVVDGATGDWNLSGDFFARMYRAFDPSKPWESSLYLRYSCTEQRLYGLVLAEPGYVVDPTPADAWIKIDGVPGNLVDGASASFAWVNSGATVMGWEASAPLAPGSYQITAHIEVLDGGRQTSGTTGVSARTSIPLVIECGTVPPPPDHPAVTIVKSVNGDDANAAPGTMVLVGGAVEWTYRVTNTGDVALTGVAVTDDRGVVVTCPATTLAVGASMTCTGSGTAVAGQYTNIGTVTAGSAISGTRVTASDAANYFGADPHVSIVKSVNGDDANTAPGPMVLKGSQVTWTYLVTNTGNVALTALNVTDDKGVAVSCPASTLAAGASMTCTGSGTAVAGQYTNTGTVTGNAPVGPAVTASDVANYFGADPRVAIVKSVNGSDANTAPGVYILAGDSVTWTYAVTNTGNVSLADVTVTDDRGVAVSCPANTLAVGASITCTGNGTAVEGQYTNIGTVVAAGPLGSSVTASDPANYFGARPHVSIVKSVNGDDANTAPGPMVLKGSPVAWTYVVTNDGNVALTGVTVSDDRGVVVSCPAATLAAGASMTCTGSGTAIAGAYVNTGTVRATAPVGPAVTASDVANYFGADPRATIVKSVNGSDANTAPGIYLPVGAKVTWTYLVTNTGNVPLAAVAVTDDRGVVVTCPANTLAVGASMTCTGSGTAVAGQYTNIGTVTANGPLGSVVTARDAANYFGVVLGKTMGFWGNNNGVATVNGRGGYAANAVTLGLLTGRNAVIDTQAEALRVLPNTLNACGKGTPAIFGTATADCTVAKGININSLNTLAGQTLALGYNIRLVSGYNGQTMAMLQASGSLTGLPLTATSTVSDVFALANSLIANSGTGGITTQAQIGAMNSLLGILNREAW